MKGTSHDDIVSCMVSDFPSREVLHHLESNWGLIHRHHVPGVENLHEAKVMAGPQLCHSLAQLSTAGQNLAQPGTAWHSQAELGTTWHSLHTFTQFGTA